MFVLKKVMKDIYLLTKLTESRLTGFSPHLIHTLLLGLGASKNCLHAKVPQGFLVFANPFPFQKVIYIY